MFCLSGAHWSNTALQQPVTLLKTIQFPQTSCWRLLLLFLFLKLTHDCALTTMLYHSLETEKKWVTAYCSVSQIHTEESDSSFHTTDHITKKQRRAIDSTNIYTVICNFLFKQTTEHPVWKVLLSFHVKRSTKWRQMLFSKTQRP